MAISKFHFTAISAWLVLVVIIAGVSRAMGLPVTLSSALLLLVAAVVPVAIVLAVFPGAPSPTISQVLYDGEQTARDVAKRTDRGPRDR